MLYTLLFGFKDCAYVNHTKGMVPISFCRFLGIPSLLSTDDRLVCGSKDKNENKGNVDGYNNVIKSIYVMCRLLTSLLYFLNLLKCRLKPTKCVKFLGMLLDSEKLAFILMLTFKELRESIVGQREVNTVCWQLRFLYLAITSGLLFSRKELASRNSKNLYIYKPLREELEY